MIALNYNLDEDKNLTAAAAYATYKDDAVILVSNSADLTVDYAIVVDQELDFVKKVSVNNADKDAPVKTYTLQDLSVKADDTNVVVIGDVEKNDYVITTTIANRDVNGTGDLLVIQAAETEVETITQVTRNYGTTKKLASEGVEYEVSPVEVLAEVQPAGSIEDKFEVTPYAAVESKGEYVLIYDDFFGKLIGVAPVEADNTVNYAYVAQFGHKINTDPTLNDKYALTAHIYFADGTNGVYTVETGNKLDNAFYGKVNNDERWYFQADTTTEYEFRQPADANYGVTYKELNAVELYDGPDANDTVTNADYGVSADATKNGKIGLYNVTIQDDGKALIKALPNGNSTDANFTNLKKGVTYMGTDGANPYYGSSKTVTFFVHGMYDEDADDKGLTVGVVTGMANMPSVGATGNGATQTTLASLTDDATGEPVVLTYKGYTSDAAARAAIASETIGFYTDSGKKIDPLKTYANTVSAKTPKGTVDYAVAGQFEQFAYYGDILTLYTDINSDNIGVIATETPVIDLTKNNITSLEALDDLIEARQEVYTNAGVDLPTNNLALGVTKTAVVSYSYGDDNTADFIYITDVIDAYSKDYTQNDSTIQNADDLKAATKLVGNTLNVEYVDGQVPSEVAKEYLATLGYTLNKYVGIGAERYVEATRDGVTTTFALTENVWYTVTVDGKLVGYMKSGSDNVVVEDLENGATGHIKSTDNGTTWNYNGADTETLTGADNHVAYKTGYYVVNTVTPSATGNVTAATATHDGYVHKNGSLKVSVEFTTATSPSTADVKANLASTAQSITKDQTVAKADVANGTIVEYTITGINADVADLTVTIADVTP